MKRLALVAALAAVVALAASGPATASSWPHAAGGLAAGGSHRSAVGEKLATCVFLRRAAESNLFEILKSQLALKRAKSPAVRDIAQLLSLTTRPSWGAFGHLETASGCGCRHSPTGCRG